MDVHMRARLIGGQGRAIVRNQIQTDDIGGQITVRMHRHIELWAVSGRVFRLCRILQTLLRQMYLDLRAGIGAEGVVLRNNKIAQ